MKFIGGRTVPDNIVEGKSHNNVVIAWDGDGAGGASHEYSIRVNNPEDSCEIVFQKGPINDDNEPNGIHIEDLMTICIDRLRGFQTGPFRSRENAICLTHLEEGLMWLQKRTRDRVSRGVEGTHQV